MIKNELGKTGIKVSSLCFGVLPMGPLQKNMDINEGAEIIVHALEQGINFLDTAQMYKTYPYIKYAIKKIGYKPVIASKSTASKYNEMQKAVDEAIIEMDISHIDIMHIHAARANENILFERQEALLCLKDNKKKRKVKAIGLSTHSVKAVLIAADSPDIDVIFPLINYKGIGILDGTRLEMEEAIQYARKKGKAIYLMKIFGGGKLLQDYENAIKYIHTFKEWDSVAIGMITKDEVNDNVNYFSERKITNKKTLINKSFIILKMICNGCATCINNCHSDAITIIGNHASIDKDKCVSCGYCSGVCPQFAIRMV